MNINIFENADEVAVAAGNVFAEQLKVKPNSVFSFATGSTPVKMYDYLAQLNRKNEISFKDVTTFNLDEYVGIESDDVNSYYYFMHKNLFDKIDINCENTHILNGKAEDPEKECEDYERLIEQSGGIDIQLLGVGVNGHIGFNEPSNIFADKTFVVKLTESTIEVNSAYFPNNDIPLSAFTMGIGSIMRAKKIVFIATGKTKAHAVKEMAKGDISPKNPASILRFHQNAYIFLDKEAAALL